MSAIPSVTGAVKRESNIALRGGGCRFEIVIRSLRGEGGRGPE